MYDTAIDAMLEKTSTPIAPWIIVESNDKYYARVKILDAVIEKIRAGISNRKKKAGKMG